jgi:hypothetical protein
MFLYPVLIKPRTTTNKDSHYLYSVLAISTETNSTYVSDEGCTTATGPG